MCRAASVHAKEESGNRNENREDVSRSIGMRVGGSAQLKFILEVIPSARRDKVEERVPVTMVQEIFTLRNYSCSSNRGRGDGVAGTA